MSLSTVEYAGKTAVLSFNRDVTEQQAVAEALHRRDAILEAVSFAAEKLLSGGDWEENIQSVLERLGQSMSVSRAYIFKTILARRAICWRASGTSGWRRGSRRKLTIPSFRTSPGEKTTCKSGWKS